MSAVPGPTPAGRAALTLVRYDEGHRQLWDAFIPHSNQGTLFHTRAFLAYHPAGRFVDASLLFFKHNELCAVLPAALDPHTGRNVLRSHPGASFGGPATAAALGVQECDRLVTLLLEHCRRQGYAGVEITLPPPVYFSHPNNHLDYVLWRHGFRYRKREVTSIIPADPPAGLLPREFHRAVRRAQRRGVTIQESDDFPAFHAHLRNHMLARHHVEPTHSLADLQCLRRLLPGQLRLFTACLGAEMIAGTLLFLCNPRAALAFYYLSHREGFRQYHGFELLMFEVLRWCRAQGLRALDFGTFTLNSEPNWGLANFKESFGAQGIFRDTLYLELG
ncbi:MAG: GNAT family N-acetyltransferase [candidate division KSB1 bacterium]|nr:GNAT family N-acetyltransferase [candidate division KSB1 bacterium]MDZ7276061.1 GNAT family N-acetyltransferase [candidate division KSB1 bacterium]MDZ7285657.1 GNAT family N-acetyltransferase [candidate division KSB1 bacterium]MDZ7298689.1 GNAT family N-acetyltransferase [candidate division KSB1 bacterium]MDZ7308403.1 GNAT family N-acetyltransferase [candidate division KSB1 bacterium]